MTYLEFIKEKISSYDYGCPIYTSVLAESLSKEFSMKKKDAAAATSIAVKRILDKKILPELRRYRSGIYYRTTEDPFGEIEIDSEALVVDKYLSNYNGYETGYSLLNRIGLSSQIPAKKTIASNKATECMRLDIELGVYVCPPKIHITKENLPYLQTLDAIEYMDKGPVDEENPYKLLSDHIERLNLNYRMLLSLAQKYYSKKTILKLASIAGEI